ncbi:MAG: DsbA family protein [Alphaproteobacteria bacterium]|nr:DsbA family protein [Alphaproteobacteria bacterium]
MNTPSAPRRSLLPLSLILGLLLVLATLMTSVATSVADEKKDAQNATTTLQPKAAKSGDAKSADKKAADPKVLDDLDRPIGAADAPLTVYEYSSLTCSHCAAFHKDLLPKIKAAYIDTGKVRWVVRDYPLDGVALRAAVAARCAEPSQFFTLIDLLYHEQAKWTAERDPQTAVMRYARLSGLNDDKLKACNQDDRVMNQIVAKRQVAETTFKIQSTPTFVIGGDMVVGARDYATFEGAINKALAAVAAPAPAAPKPAP